MLRHIGLRFSFKEVSLLKLPPTPNKIQSLVSSFIPKTVFFVLHLLLWLKETPWVICPKGNGTRSKNLFKQ